MRIEPEWLDYSISRMEEAFANVTVEELVHHMKSVGCGHNSACIEVLGGIWYTLIELLYKPIKRAPARHVVCKFYGGPEGRQAVYDGTLVTMLIDRLLTQAANKIPSLLAESFDEEN